MSCRESSCAGMGLVVAMTVVQGCFALEDEPVQVVLDLDAQKPGLQSTVKIRACEAVLHGVAVYVRDPQAKRSFYSLGYFGALDRGIALGHWPTNNLGSVTGILASPVSPANPGNVGQITPGYIPVFQGLEIWYMEHGATSPSVLSANPHPVFTADIMLSGTHPGDIFRLFLLDFVSVWTDGQFGAFSTTRPVNGLDSGGDSVPDGTITSIGIDPDQAVPAPPAEFMVDYIDGPGGALIEIIPRLGDVDADNDVDVSDLIDVVNAWGSCSLLIDCPADQDGNGHVGVEDVVTVLSNWGPCS